MKTRTLIFMPFTGMLFVALTLSAQTTLPSTITVDTWLGPNGNPADTEYLINGTVKVYGNDGTDQLTTLTIEPGVTIRFTKSASSILQVGEGSSPGSIKVKGTEAEPVLFTSAAASPAKGDWRHINLTSLARECVIDHAIIEYSGLSQGYGSDGSLLNAADSLVMSNSVIRYSGRHGIVLTAGAKKIYLDNNSLVDNDLNGLYSYNASNFSIFIDGSEFLSNGSYGLNIQQDVNFSLTNSSFDPNTAGTMILHPNNVGGIASSNSFTAPGLIEVTSGNITRFAFWPGFFSDYGTWYYINNAIKVFGTVDAPTILHIGDGAELRFAKGAGSWLQVGENANPGNLYVTGTAEKPVTFTSAAAQPAKGDWRFIYLTSVAKKCTFERTNIFYAGLSQGYGDDCALKSEADTLVITNSTVGNSGRHGIALRASSEYVSMDQVTLENNTTNGLVTIDGSGYKLFINNSQIQSNGQYGLNVQHNIDFTVKNSTFDPNTLGIMVLHPNIVGGIDPSNSFSDPGRIEVISGDITRFAFWPGFFSNDSVYYYINNAIKVYGTGESPTTLHIGEGAELRFAKGAGSWLQVGENTNFGNLFVTGTAEKPVTFTSAAVQPAEGDWRFIYLSSVAKKCTFDHTRILYAGLSQGYGDDCALKSDADTLIMTSSTVSNSNRHGIALRENTNFVSLDDVKLSNNANNGLVTIDGSGYTLFINNSQILSNGQYGLNIQHNISFTLEGSTFDANTSGMMLLNPNIVGGIDPMTTFTEKGRIEVISGNITKYSFWPGFFSDDSVYYYINNAIKVYGTGESPTTLHIGEGAELRFAKGAGSWLQVGENANLGNLFVTGTEEKPVTFTSAAAQPAKGDWRFINLISSARKCTFDHTRILYAGLTQGYGDDCALKSDADTLIMTSSKVSYSNKHGIAIRANANLVSLDDVELSNNANNGLVTIDGSAYTLMIDNSLMLSNGHYGLNVQHNINFNIKKSIFDPNTSGCMVLHPNIVGGVDSTNAFTQPGRIEVISGDITKFAFWPGFFSDDSVYYYINDALKVYGTSEFPTTLHIGEGAELRFAKGAGSWLQVGENANLGNLFVTGTEEKPVTFTSAAAQPAKGDWRFINLISSARKCTFDHTRILYAGLTQGYGDDCALKSDADTLIMTSSTVSYSNKHGIAIRANANFVSLDDVELSNNANNGLVTIDGSAYTLMIDNSRMLSNGHYGLNVQHNINFNIKKSIFDPNTSGCMVLHPNIVGGVDSTNTFTQPGRIEVISGDITKFAFWPGFFSDDSVYYYINNNLKVYGTPDIPATLHIGKGSELRFASSSSSILQVGEGSNLGKLMVIGSAEEPVTFTSFKELPAPGDWRYVYLTSKSVDCVMDHVNLLYGGLSQGYDQDAALRIESSSPSITNCLVSKSGRKGIYISGNSDPYTFGNTFSENSSHGVYASNPANDYDFSFNNFMLNTGSGCLNNSGTYWVDASYSYWGSEDGPSGIGPGTGDDATGQVIIDPWLTGPVTAGIDLLADTDSLTYQESSATVHVTTGLRWEVSTENDWITFDTMQGTKIDSFSVNFTENPSADPRTAIITVTSGDTLSQPIEITQPGAPPEFSHNAPPEIPAQAGMLDIDIHTNYAWSLSADCDWTVPDPVEGNFDGTIMVSYSENTAYETRSCNLTVTGGGLTEVITLTQLASTVGILNGSLNDHFSVFPNPVSNGILYIQWSEDGIEPDRTYTLVNILGQVMVSGKLLNSTNQIDVSAMADGVYILRLSLDSKDFIDLIIVIRK